MSDYLIYNGRATTEFNLKLENGVTFASPSKNLEFEKIGGLDGEVVTGDGTLNNVTRDFPFTISSDKKRNVQEIATELSNWLKSSNEWHDLEFSGDPDYIYRAIYIDEYNLDRVTNFYGKVVLSFICKPYKFLKSGRGEITLGTNIINPTNRPSRPKITIKGTGNITLKIGESLWEFKNISGGIIVDTLLDVVTTLDGKSLAWDKTITYPLPKIATGKQLVTITGAVTDITIIPNWEAIVG